VVETFDLVRSAREREAFGYLAILVVRPFPATPAVSRCIRLVSPAVRGPYSPLPRQLLR
jgi:hypothetical protein